MGAEAGGIAWVRCMREIDEAVSAAPFWDAVILTASSEHQAEGFRLQIESRRAFLPKGTQFFVIPDEGGMRVGSGGATLSALKLLKENGIGFAGKRILVIHSGGDSRRVPQYSALGKLFSPVPRALAGDRCSTLFDEFMAAMGPVAERIPEGMLLLAGDVLLLFDPAQIEWDGSGAAVVSFSEDVETGKNHGVYLRGEDGNVKRFLHKQSVETLRAAGAVDRDGCVNIDTGMILFGVDVLDALWSLISQDGHFDEARYRAFVNDTVRLSLYGDFQYPLASDSTLEAYFAEKPEGEFSAQLEACRTAVWDALRLYRLKLLQLSPARFLHFGTTREVLELMCEGPARFEGLGWTTSVGSCAPGIAATYSVVYEGAQIGERCYLESSCVHGNGKIGRGSILSCVEIRDEAVPEDVVLHGLKQMDGKYVCRIFGTGDNPKEGKLFGREIPNNFDGTLWNAPLYPEKDTLQEAIAAALQLYDKVMKGDWGGIEPGKSLSDGFRDADPEAILSWERRMRELVVMEEMRRHYLAGKTLSGPEGEQETGKAFAVLSEAILRETLEGLKENLEARISADETEVSLPLRVNFGGGWSDTPPYCNENGGTVLNAAILLNGERPVRVRIQKLEEKKIVLASRDMDVCGEFTEIAPLQSVGDPYDPYVLQKAALLACGVIPSSGGDLGEVLERLGGGFRMDTEVTGVPKGSGLGTSSILAAACVKALFLFFGIQFSEDDLYGTVLCVEQLMSTGGGWQDQVGGVTDGIKYTVSQPGLKQVLSVEHVRPDDSVMAELNERFCLINTGQRRLARNLLRDVVGRYIGGEPDAVYALGRIREVAQEMKTALEQGSVDEFARLLSEHWKLSIMIDAGSTNKLIDRIFEAADDLLDGRMVCGAGGGGFLQAVLKKGVRREELQKRLEDAFPGTEIRVWDCTLI